jgi:hypothetical protein
VVAIDTFSLLQAGALVLLALGSGLVLHLITSADAEEERAQPLPHRPRPAPEAPDTLRRAA